MKKHLIIKDKEIYELRKVNKLEILKYLKNTLDKRNGNNIADKKMVIPIIMNTNLNIESKETTLEIFWVDNILINSKTSTTKISVNKPKLFNYLTDLYNNKISKNKFRKNKQITVLEKLNFNDEIPKINENRGMVIIEYENECNRMKSIFYLKFNDNLKQKFIIIEDIN